MSASFNQVLAQIELWTKGEDYGNDVYILPKHLDEKVAALHLKIGVKLTQLSKNRPITSASPRKGRSNPSITATDRRKTSCSEKGPLGPFSFEYRG